jgi:TolB-like protein/Tfp pilus assembly protein PilF
MTSDAPESETGPPESSPPRTGSSPSVRHGHGPHIEFRFLTELRRRNVFRIAAAYAGVSWLLVHVGTVLGESFQPLHRAMPTVIAVLLAALPLVLLSAWFFELTPEGFRLTRRVASAQSIREASARKLELITMAVLALAILAMLLDHWALHRPADETLIPVIAVVLLVLLADRLIGRGLAGARAAQPAIVAPASTTAHSPPSIAVLPFANLTGDAGKEYFGDGMAEELIHMLTRVPGLKVPSRTSSFAYKGKNIDIRRIAKDLGVETVLEGSVRSAGERIRVTAQLVNAQTGFHHWSESYDRRDADIFRLQDELAAAILRALEVNLGGKPPAAVLPEPPTPNIEAYQLYLRGRALVQRGGLDNTRAGVRLFEQAIAVDPNFARAYAGVAAALVYLVYNGVVTPELLSDIEQNAQRALALDAELSEAYASLSGLSVTRARWVDAEQHYRKALSLNPADPLVHIYYGSLLLPATGRLRVALSAAQEAYRLAPAIPLAAMCVAVANNFLGQYADALAYGQLAVDLGMPRSTPPLPFVDASVAMNAGRHAEAAEYMNSVLAPSVLEAGGAAVVRLVYAAVAGAAEKRAAIEALQTLRTGAARNEMVHPIMVMLSTTWFTRLGAIDLAYELAQAVPHELETTGVLSTIHVATCWLPEMRPFRQDPRFQTYVTRLGLLEYWKQYGPPDDCDFRDRKLICH